MILIEGVDENYLNQILFVLCKAGLIESIRGPQGGLRFAREPANITILDASLALEGPLLPIVSGRDSLTPTEAIDRAIMHGVWEALRAILERHLGQVIGAALRLQLVQLLLRDHLCIDADRALHGDMRAQILLVRWCRRPDKAGGREPARAADDRIPTSTLPPAADTEPNSADAAALRIMQARLATYLAQAKHIGHSTG